MHWKPHITSPPHSHTPTLHVPVPKAHAVPVLRLSSQTPNPSHELRASQSVDWSFSQDTPSVATVGMQVPVSWHRILAHLVPLHNALSQVFRKRHHSAMRRACQNLMAHAISHSERVEVFRELYGTSSTLDTLLNGIADGGMAQLVANFRNIDFTYTMKSAGYKVLIGGHTEGDCSTVARVMAAVANDILLVRSKVKAARACSPTPRRSPSMASGAPLVTRVRSGSSITTTGWSPHTATSIRCSGRGDRRLYPLHAAGVESGVDVGDETVRLRAKRYRGGERGCVICCPCSFELSRMPNPLWTSRLAARLSHA